MHYRSQLDTEIFNDGTKDGDVLNSGCGADFVKVNFYIQKKILILKLIFDLIFYLNISSFGFLIFLLGTTKMPTQFGKRGRWS